jgi:hypothetical protein
MVWIYPRGYFLNDVYDTSEYTELSKEELQ